jgi:hypothetical protein
MVLVAAAERSAQIASRPGDLTWTFRHRRGAGARTVRARHLVAPTRHRDDGVVATPGRIRNDLRGRDQELAVLQKHVCAGEIVHVHGLPGIGKSALLDALVRRLDAGSVHVFTLDCRVVEPTERGFLRAVGGFRDVEGFVEHLGALGGRAVIALDHYEVFRLLDTWLRRNLVPALPPDVGLAFACRERPVASWFGVAGFHEVSLGQLQEAEACALLEERGVPAVDAPRLNRIARGHPLALLLASAGVAENPQLGLVDAAMSRVVAELTRLYFEDVDDPLTRRAIEAASVVRRTTATVMDAMLDGAGEAGLRSLLGLPLVATSRDGLVVHEAVREAVAVSLRSTDPVRYRDYRRAAWRCLREEMRAAAPVELWRYTADILYLLDNPVVREAFFPTDAQPIAVEPATARDGPVIGDIADRHDGPESARLLRRWWAVAPSTFSVSRDCVGAPTAFFVLLGDAEIRRPLVGDDLVVRSWARHLQEHPVRRGEVALGLRRWLDIELGEAPGATQAACWLDVKRTYLALRPALRRMYVVVAGAATYWPVVRELAFRPLAAPVALDGIEYTTVVLDFGPGSVDGWLVDVLATELGLADEPALDPTAHELTVRGAPVALTPLEFGLFRYLREREGRTVTRPELLRAVWGDDHHRGSNVVDAVVHTLRGKLGSGAAAVEAVRGRGYRLRDDWRTHLQ